MSYISDAMGHSLGNQGQITQRYISPFSLEKRMRYNSLLIRKDEEALLASKYLKEALIALKKKEIERLENELIWLKKVLFVLTQPQALTVTKK